jgi:RimJ/RimL family protein N-acetyltransferase
MKPISYERYFWQNELVRLRSLTPEDWEAAYPSLFDSPARLFLQEETELPPVKATVQEQHRNWANFNQETGLVMFTIDTLDSTSVGGLVLNSINERNGTFSIGIQIFTDQRNKGYGTAAMRLLLKYAFLERRFNKFNSGCLEGNIASIRMHQNLGCVQEGVRRQMYYSGGKYLANILFGLTKDEYIENERKLVR